MTSNSVIEINDHGLSKRMAQFPKEFDAVKDATMDASLLTLWENVPPYPERPNESSYDRTGTLGRTLGASMSGAISGKPDIYEKKKLGSEIEGRFGTKLSYADYVIGESQAWMHYIWWRLTDVKKSSEAKIISLWNLAAEKMAKFLDGKGL